MTELDKRVGEYAVEIVRDADLLLADAANLNAEQQEFAGQLKQNAVRFLALYHEHLTDFADLTQNAIILVHDIRGPLGLIVGYCELLLMRESGSFSQSQLQLLHQMKAAYTFIMNTFTQWVNPDHEQN